MHTSPDAVRRFADLLVRRHSGRLLLVRHSKTNKEGVADIDRSTTSEGLEIISAATRTHLLPFARCEPRVSLVSESLRTRELAVRLFPPQAALDLSIMVPELYFLGSRATAPQAFLDAFEEIGYANLRRFLEHPVHGSAMQDYTRRYATKVSTVVRSHLLTLGGVVGGHLPVIYGHAVNNEMIAYEVARALHLPNSEVDKILDIPCGLGHVEGLLISRGQVEHLHSRSE